MKASLLPLLMAVLIVGPVRAQEDNGPIGFDGQVRVASRYVDAPDSEAQDFLRAQLRIDGWVNVTEDGCLKVRGRVVTGSGFTSEWGNTGLRDGEADLKLALRHLYVDSTCLSENARMELGAMPARGHGSLGLSAAGWIDGMRVTVQEPDSDREWIFSVGRVGDTSTPNALKRDFDGVNHAQVSVKQKVSDELTGFVSGAISGKQVFTRAGLEAAVTKYVSWMKTVGVEALFNEKRKMLGTMVSSSFDLKEWKTRVFFAKLEKNPDQDDVMKLAFKSFYGYGSNVYLETSRDISPTTAINFVFRVGDAGPLVEAGVTKKFCARPGGCKR